MVLAREREQPWSPDDKLELFECRVDVWQLGPAVEILKQIEGSQDQSSPWAHAAYALLAVGFTYFEMIGKTLNPASEPYGTAGLDFNHGFCDVYPGFAVAGSDRSDKSLPEVRAFRDRVRNGIYHLGYTKNNLLIHNSPNVSHDFLVDSSAPAPVYLVNPHRMIRTVVEHFPGFMTRLRDSTPEATDLRSRFVRFFDQFHA